jgi:hypothetical protein
MTHQIISKEMIRAKARAAYMRGAERDDHGMNFGSPAIEDWQNEWDRCERLVRKAEHMMAEVAA